MISIVVNSEAETQFIGNYTYGRVAGIKQSEVLPHPENTNGWKVYGLEMVGALTATMGVRLSKRNALSFAEAFRTANAVDNEHGTELANTLMTSIIETAKEIAESKEMQEEMGLHEDGVKFATVKRQLLAFVKVIETAVEYRAHLIVLNELYQVYTTYEDWYQEDNYNLVYGLYEALSPEFVKFIKDCRKEQVAWDRATAKALKKLDFVEAFVD